MVVFNDNVILKLDEVMQEKNISGYRLAELTGITQDNISNIKNGDQMPTLKTLGKFCKALSVGIEQLVEFR